jgi:hypothetical protein
LSRKGGKFESAQLDKMTARKAKSKFNAFLPVKAR